MGQNKGSNVPPFGQTPTIYHENNPFSFKQLFLDIIVIIIVFLPLL